MARPKKSDPRGTRYSDSVKKAVRKALEKGGLTAKQISEKYGPTVFTIKDWKKRWGLSRRRKDSAPRVSTAAIVESMHNEMRARRLAKYKPTTYRDSVTHLYTKAGFVADDLTELISDIGAEVRQTEDSDARLIRRRDLLKLASNHAEALVAILLRAADA